MEGLGRWEGGRNASRIKRLQPSGQMASLPLSHKRRRSMTTLNWLTLFGDAWELLRWLEVGHGETA